MPTPRESDAMHCNPTFPLSAETAGTGKSGHASCILVVTGRVNPAPPVMEYVIQVADRLGSRILLATITPGGRSAGVSPLSPATGDGVTGEDLFRTRAEARGINYQRIAESGQTGKVVSRLCHVVKRVEFVVIDQGIKMEEVAAGSSVPVFTVVPQGPKSSRYPAGCQTRTFSYGETRMKTATRRTYLAKTLIFGAMTAGLYAAVFTYADVIMKFWTKGGIYCLLPVATVFVFSYAHGSFTGNFWSALGIEGSKASATKQKETRVSTADTARKRPDTRPRAQVSL